MNLQLMEIISDFLLTPTPESSPVVLPDLENESIAVAGLVISHSNHEMIEIPFTADLTATILIFMGLA